MAVLPIVNHPADVLEKPGEKVTAFNRELALLLKDMYETMLAADGVGLAAPQVGVSKRVAVVDTGDEYGKIELVNPKVIEKKGEQTGPEGCLSFPGIYGEVNRADYVKVHAFNRHGRPFTIEADGFLARALQHEIDHLDGILFTSKVLRYYEDDELEEMEGDEG
ncbi:peptide deformylase [Metabacillus sp. GX 13764]|uniref:peptide deformylase n=1 Tax=Metabacillus kandeliae TaxID=2900151 RepID=UPI001E47C7DC|nr:peptide deformylase [Metabacillus kandeliae]MCD7033832.1 peptide deformylase [Metabacillus kandeliae]